MYYGYHRVSTKEQKLDRGITEINKFCSDNNINLNKIFFDKQTGKTFDRPRYIVMKEDVLREGDVLILTEIDRLGRNKNGILKELQYFKERSIRIMVLEIPTTLMEFSSFGNEFSKIIFETINNMLIEMYTTFAQAEIEKRQKRQKEGIQEMKNRGEWDKYGRKRIISLSKFKEEYEKVIKGEIRPSLLRKKLNLSNSTFYRYISELNNK